MEQQERKRDIRNLSLDVLLNFFSQHGGEAFRAGQVYDWLWRKSCTDFDRMTNLSLSTRILLKNHFILTPIRVDTTQHSKDGTRKNAIRLHDGFTVESALIPTGKRVTACVSSQVGCSLSCTFCATGQLKNKRNLNTGEIYDQIIISEEQSKLFYGMSLTNIVFMGMGEPLLNYSNVISAIHHITSPKGLNIAPRRITVSTVGIAKMIIKMADDGVAFNLAVSLHAALNKTRSSIMGINESNTLGDLAEALRFWYRKTNRKVTYEYIVWKGVNDDSEHAEALLKFCKIIPCKVNLIEYNPIRGGIFQQAEKEALDRYQHLLKHNGIIARIRKSRGQDIDAACGQLANVIPK